MFLQGRISTNQNMFQKTKTGSVELKRSLTGNVAVHTLKGGIKGTVRRKLMWVKSGINR